MRVQVLTTHVVFSSLGAGLTILVLWVFSGGFRWLSPAFAGVVILVLGTSAVLRDAGILKLSLPENRRLIPQHSFSGSAVRGTARFSFELGTGVRTYLNATGPYLLALAILLLSPSPKTLIVIALGFGVGRTLPLMVIAAGTPALSAMITRVTTRKPVMTTLCATALLLVVGL